MYLDHAATTAISPAALAAVVDDHGHLGNPSSLHGAGREARRRVEEHRERLAEALGARPSEVVLTSGGTESDNIGVLGLARGRRRADPARTRTTGGSGLGLAIALEDARLHHGWLQAWGETGEGSRFRLTVPRSAGGPLSSSPLPLTPREGDLPGSSR